MLYRGNQLKIRGPPPVLRRPQFDVPQKIRHQRARGHHDQYQQKIFSNSLCLHYAPRKIDADSRYSGTYSSRYVPHSGNSRQYPKNPMRQPFSTLPTRASNIYKVSCKSLLTRFTTSPETPPKSTSQFAHRVEAHICFRPTLLLENTSPAANTNGPPLPPPRKSVRPSQTG